MIKPTRTDAVRNIQERRFKWQQRYNGDGRYGAFDPNDITVGEIENELLRMKGKDECPMYERDYNEGWR